MDLIEVVEGARDGELRHPWETARLAVVKTLIERHVTLVSGSRVIDIGCGDAFVIGRLAEAFPETLFYGVDSGFATDIEPNGTHSRRPNVHLLSNLDRVPAEPAAAASLVLLMDVLEHISDDVEFLKDLVARPFVDRSTTVLVTVPSYQSLFSAHDMLFRHYRRYSNRILTQRLDQAGLHVSEIGYFFFSLVPIRGLQVLKERLFGPAAIGASGLRRKPNGLLTAALLTRMLVADATAALMLRRLGITIPGLSNYAICRKSA